MSIIQEPIGYAVNIYERRIALFAGDRYVVSLGSGTSSYRKHWVYESLGAAEIQYDGLNVAKGYKKRLSIRRASILFTDSGRPTREIVLQREVTDRWS